MRHYGHGFRVEIYNFDGDDWRAGTVTEPAFQLAGWEYMRVELDKPIQGHYELLIAPELVGRHVRPALA